MGHRAYCRFENSRVSWNHAGYGFIKEYSTDSDFSDRELWAMAQDMIKKEARAAAAKFTQDAPVNTMGIHWPK